MSVRIFSVAKYYQLRTWVEVPSIRISRDVSIAVTQAWFKAVV